MAAPVLDPVQVFRSEIRDAGFRIDGQRASQRLEPLQENINDIAVDRAAKALCIILSEKSEPSLDRLDLSKMATRLIKDHVVSKQRAMSEPVSDLWKKSVGDRLALPEHVIPTDKHFVDFCLKNDILNRLPLWWGEPYSKTWCTNSPLGVTSDGKEIAVKIGGVWTPWSAAQSKYFTDVSNECPLQLSAGLFQPLPDLTSMDVEHADVETLCNHAILFNHVKTNIEQHWIMTVCARSIHSWLRLTHPDGRVYSLGNREAEVTGEPVAKTMALRVGQAMAYDPTDFSIYGKVHSIDLKVDPEVWANVLRNHLLQRRDGSVFGAARKNCTSNVSWALAQAGCRDIGLEDTYDARRGKEPKKRNVIWRGISNHMLAFAIACVGDGLCGADLVEKLKGPDAERWRGYLNGLDVTPRRATKWRRAVRAGYALCVGSPQISSGFSMARWQDRVQNHRHELRDAAFAQFKKNEITQDALSVKLQEARWAIPLGV